MSTAAQATPTQTDPVLRWLERRESMHRAEIDRAAINRENAQHSTGPRTEAGKQRSSLNALRHGLTARTAVLPSEDPAAYEQHCRQFRDEYQPANATETQLVLELAETAWRLNRIPLFEAGLLTEAADQESLPAPQVVIDQLAKLGLYSSRLSRQFQKALQQLRALQEERRLQERRQLTEAAELLLRHQCKGLPWEPAADGFVFPKDQIERQARKLLRQNPTYYASHPSFERAAQPPATSHQPPSACSAPAPMM